MKNIILASTSTVHGSDYLEYLLEELRVFFKDINFLLFIPYARPGGISYDKYTSGVARVFLKIGISVKGIHEFENPKKAIESADAIFVGGGNTFVLVNELYKNELITILRTVIDEGTPYFGTSAGSNICGLTVGTTNDMPIVYPAKLETLGLIPFNINPHYLDSSPDSTHMGETREARIKEFHKFNSIPVVGLREGSYLRVENDRITLKGELSARIFEKNKSPYEADSNSDLSLLQ